MIHHHTNLVSRTKALLATKCASVLIMVVQLATLSCLLASCATLSPRECKVTNWQALGEADGTRGVLPSHINKHASACAKAGIAPDVKAWRAGRALGLKNYCTGLNAYVIGRDGRSLAPVCGFVGRMQLMEMERRYLEGRQAYRLQQQADTLRRDASRWSEWCFENSEQCHNRPYIY